METLKLDDELRKITRRKRIDPAAWKQLVEYIPNKSTTVLTQLYDKPLNTKTVDPLNSNSFETIEQWNNRIFKHFKTHFVQSPPFTIVRIAEILLEPREHYSTPEKFLKAMESVMCVSSTLADFDSPVMNGVDKEDDNKSENGHGKPKESQDGTGMKIGDDSHAVLLTKIDWLTEEDIAEIESEQYLMEEYPLHEEEIAHENDQEQEQVQHGNEERHDEVQNGGLEEVDEYPLEDPKKRKVEEGEYIANETPEKKPKTVETQVQDHSNGEEVNTPEDTTNETSCDESKEVEEDLQRAKQDTEEYSTIPKDSNVKVIHKPNKEQNIQDADTTLPDDKMQDEDNTSQDDSLEEANTTLPEDKMDIDE